MQIRTVNAGDLDLSNSSGRMLARILGSVARQESEHKGERRRRANAQRAASGAWRADGPRLFGFTRRGEPLEPEATAIRVAITDVLAGRSLRSITTDWNNRGIRSARGKPWSNLTLRRTLMNPVYAGLRTYQGAVVGPGDWEALVDPDTHRGLIAFLTDESRRPAVSFERKHMGSGVYECSVCDGKLYATYPHGPRRPMVYACRPAVHVARLGGPLDELVEALVLARLREAGIAARLHGGSGVDAIALQARRRALEARMDELATSFMNGGISSSQMKSGTSEFKKQVAGIDKVLAEHARTSAAGQLLKDGVDKLQERWDNCSPDLRGKIVAELLVVTVLPTPRGVKGVDRDGVINTDYIRIDWRTA